MYQRMLFRFGNDLDMDLICGVKKQRFELKMGGKGSEIGNGISGWLSVWQDTDDSFKTVWEVLDAVDVEESLKTRIVEEVEVYKGIMEEMLVTLFFLTLMICLFRFLLFYLDDLENHGRGCSAPRFQWRVTFIPMVAINFCFKIQF